MAMRVGPEWKFGSDKLSRRREQRATYEGEGAQTGLGGQRQSLTAPFPVPSHPKDEIGLTQGSKDITFPIKVVIN